MNRPGYPLVIRLYFLASSSLHRLLGLFMACFAGFWLGVLKRETLHLVDEFYYDNSKMYYDEEYNRSGLWNWEKIVLDKYFQESKSLLVGGVGGGREVLALRQLGYDADGFECHPRLVACANELLRKEGLVPNIQLAPRDECPNGARIYDGLIVGWGTYTLILGREQRITFLRKLRARTRAKSPLLVSFVPRRGGPRRLKMIAAIANTIRWILRRDPLELGDDLVPNYIHCFTEEELASELREAGFELASYCKEKYGYAIGIACEQSDAAMLPDTS